MGHVHAWTSTEDNAPTGTALLGQVDNHIQTTRQMVRERLEYEHLMNLTATDQQGYHRQGSARVFVGDSSPASPFPDPAGVETVGTENVGRVWVSFGSGVLSVHNGTSWVALATVAGTASKIVVRDSAGRAQMADPSAAQDIATKNYVDNHVGDALTLGGASPATTATANTIAKRDASGRVYGAVFNA